MSAPPPTMIYFEDMTLGETIPLGVHTFTADEIKVFARKYDPQPFHVDAVAAKDSLFGALCASGWHTAAIWMGMIVRHRHFEDIEMAKRGEQYAPWGPSPGFRELKWPKPVFAGDTINYRTTRIQKVDLKTRPDRGILVSRSEGLNQHGDCVFSVIGQVLIARRTPYVTGA